MTEWTTARLADLCLQISDGDWIETKDQGGDDYRLLQVSNIEVGAFRETGKFRFITEDTFRRLRCTEIEEGMVLVARLPAPVGRAWFVSSLPRRSITAVDIAILRPDPDLLDGRFCAYMFNTASQLAIWEGASSGTTRVRITRRQLAEASFRLPDLRSQKKIASILSAYDELIENNTRRIEILEEMAQAIYREWFVNFRYPGHEDVPLVDSELGPIPQGWRTGTLEDICDRIQSGGTPKRTESAFWDGGDVPWYKTGDLTDSVLLDSSEYITTEAVNRSTARMFEPETILLAIYGSPTVGRLGLVSSPSSCNQAALGLTAKLGTATTEYVWFVLAESRSYLNRVAQGAAQQNVSKTVVCAAPAVVPPHGLIQKFTDVAGPPWRFSHLLARQNSVLRAIRDLLLPRLISGEVDVSNLDIDVGELVS